MSRDPGATKFDSIQKEGYRKIESFDRAVLMSC